MTLYTLPVTPTDGVKIMTNKLSRKALRQVQNYYSGRPAADKFEEMFPGKDRYERAAKLFHHALRQTAGVMKP